MAKYEAKKFRSFEVDLAGISKKAMEEHYKLYQGYVAKANEIFDRRIIFRCMRGRRRST